MTTPNAASDAAFLDEVEDFLVSFDKPIFGTLHTLTDHDNSDESSPSEAVPASKTRASSKGRRKSKQALDPVAQHELEKAKDRKRRSLYRERRRAEEETLKQQVGELSTELAELQKANEVNRSLASAWEMVAKRQLQARVDSEEKQRRLLRAIGSRAALIQDFQNIIHDADENEDDVAFKRKRIRLEPSDSEIYEAYALELDHFYAQTDEALKTYGLDSLDVSWDKPKRQWKEDGETGYYIYADKNVMPSDCERVCKHMWQVAQMHHRQQDRVGYEGIGDPDKTAAFKFRITHRLQSGRTVTVLQRAVVRRYLENGRSVVVWRSFCEGEGIFSGMHADETGWCVSVPLPNASKPSTLTRTMMRHVPMHLSSKAQQELDRNEFTGFVLGTGSEDALEIGNRLEKLVLQEK